MTKPCETISGLRCAHAGLCWGELYFEGKPGKKTPLAQVRGCKWRSTVLERHRRHGGDDETP